MPARHVPAYDAEIDVELGAEGMNDSSSRTAEQSLLTARGIDKHFGGVFALKGANFDLRAGEVHALLGPNGAGKSTLIKILNGVYSADGGIVRVDGRERESSDVATVFQELSLIPSLTVAQNIFLGEEETHRFGLIRPKAQRVVARQLMLSLGVRLDGSEFVRDLSVATQQLVEIAKAVHRDARILVLDEPTSTLTRSDQMLLFESVRELQRTGVGIVYVTHRLNEVFELADRTTVIRDGRDVLTEDTDRLDMETLVHTISPRSDSVSSRTVDRPGATAIPIGVVNPAAGSGLRINHLCGDRFAGVTLSVAPGQIFGIAGLIGSGRTELLETVAGVRRASSGSIRLDDRDVSFKNPVQALEAGVALVPEDRRRSGLIMMQTIQGNLMLAHKETSSRFGFIDWRAVRRMTDSIVLDLQIKTLSHKNSVQQLSGGNQQKVVFGKWMQEGVKVLLLDEPTQGVDVGARAEIHRVVRRFAEDGACVIVVSSEFGELQELCDSVALMTGQGLSAPIQVDDDVTEQFLYMKLNERDS